MYPDDRQNGNKQENNSYPDQHLLDNNSFDPMLSNWRFKEDLNHLKRKQLLKFLALSILIMLVLAFGNLLLNRLFARLSLVNFEQSNFSVNVPKGYLYIRENEFYKFVEPKEGSSSKSFVIIHVSPYLPNTSYDDAIKVLNLYKSQIPNLIGQPNDSAQQFENLSSQRIIHREHEAFRVTAELVKSGRRAKIDILVVAGDSAIYAVGVAAHEEDTYLARSSNKIITSLTLYE